MILTYIWQDSLNIINLVTQDFGKYKHKISSFSLLLTTHTFAFIPKVTALATTVPDLCGLSTTFRNRISRSGKKNGVLIL
jgi:uncharacterized membrane protein YwaF